MVNRAALDEMLFEHGISQERLVALKIEFKEGRGPVSFCLRNRPLAFLLFREGIRILGRYYSPKTKEGETILLWPKEIRRYKSESPSGVLAHECGHAIVGVEKKTHPLYYLTYLPFWCDYLLFLTGILFPVYVLIFALKGIHWLALVALIGGLQLLCFVLILLPVLCSLGYYYSPNEVAAREKAAELLKDPRWNQVISSDS